MGGLFLVRTDDPDFADGAMAAARAQFALHGFSACAEKALPGWRLLHAPHIIGGPESLFEQSEVLVAVAGTLTFDGLIGRPALEALLAAASPPELDWSRLGGQFAAIVRKAGRTFLLTDYFAAFQIFHDAGMRLFSTSLLAAAKAQPGLGFDPQGLYEFAFNVFPIGNDTIFAELKTLGPDTVVELGSGGAVAHPLAKPLPNRAGDSPIGERIARHRDRLAQIVGDHVRHFGDRIFCPLSGGLDSRLVLAALRAQAAGRASSFTARRRYRVEIARAIAAEGFEVSALDKEAHEVAPDRFAEIVERNSTNMTPCPIMASCSRTA